MVHHFSPRRFLKILWRGRLLYLQHKKYQVIYMGVIYSGLIVEDLQEITVDLSATVSDAADVLKEILKE